MRITGYVFVAALAASAAMTVPASANTCQAESMTCGTTMPIGGYCECTAHGNTQGGTVVSHPALRHRSTNATAGGCGAHPNAPGCR